MAKTKKPLGVLILHGFTGSLDTVRAVVPEVEKLGLPYRMPVLRGHGTRYEDLHGVVAADWYADAEAALAELKTEAEHVVVVALSMGALLALNLAIDHEDDLAGLVLVATFLRCANPLAHLTPVLRHAFRFWPMQVSFADKELAKGCTNYKKLSTAAFSSLMDYACETELRLPHVRVPALILHARKDTAAHPVSAKILAEKLGSADKRLVWFERSDHEMLMDLEAPQVAKAIGEYLAEVVTARAEAI